MFHLLVKTHRKTGLKYLCKTIRIDWEKYSGSGKRWKYHLKKHGPDIDTTLLFKTDNRDLFEWVCEEYSVEFDVVNSPKWANLIPEDGKCGGNQDVARKLGQSNKGRKAPWKKDSGCKWGISRRGKSNPGTSQAMMGNQRGKGWKWFTNGQTNIKSRVCPTGFISGMIVFR